MTTEIPIGSQGVDDDVVRSFARDWAAAWNSHDPERVVAMMAPNCQYDDTAWSTTMRTHDEVREFLRHTWSALPDLEFYDVTIARVPGEPKAIFHWHARATMRGALDPPGYAPTLDRLEFDGFDMHEYHDGKLVRLRILFNMMDVGQQIVAVPPPGTLRERAVVFLHRLQAPGRRRANAKRSGT